MSAGGRTLKSVWSKIFGEPWLSLLVLSKGIENTVEGNYQLAKVYYALFLLLTAVWVLSDAITLNTDKVIGDGGRRIE